ncbi:protein of unknown function [Streptomyces murinus]
MDAHLDLLDPFVFQAGLGDPLGEGLDEVHRLALDHGHDLLGHDAVVHGLRQVVVGRGRPGVQAQDEVHEEGLALLAFPGEHAMVPASLQAAQRDTIHANHSCNRRERPVVPRACETPVAHESTCGHRQRRAPGARARPGTAGFTARFPR